MGIESEPLWMLYKQSEWYEAELVTVGNLTMLDFRRNDRCVCRVRYYSLEDALRDATNYRMGLELAGWSARERSDDRIA